MSATLELAPTESLVYLFSSLLSRASSGSHNSFRDLDSEPRCRVNIVDTLIFHGGQPVRWIWTDETRGTVHTHSGRNWSINDIIKAFRKREITLRGKKHTGTPQYRSSIAVVWYRTAAERLSQRVVGELELVHLLRNRGFSLQVLAVQIYLGGASLKGSGWFEHRVWRSDARVEFHQTFELVLSPPQPATVDLSDFIEGGRFAASAYAQSHATFSALSRSEIAMRDSKSSQPDMLQQQRLVVTEVQHYYAQTATSEVLRHLEAYYCCRVVDATFIMAFNSTWAPFVLGVRDVRLADVPVGVVQMRQRLFANFEEALAMPKSEAERLEDRLLENKARVNNASSDAIDSVVLGDARPVAVPSDSDEDDDVGGPDRHSGASAPFTVAFPRSSENSGEANQAQRSDEDKGEEQGLLGRRSASFNFNPTLMQLSPSGGAINKMYQIAPVSVNLASNTPALSTDSDANGVVPRERSRQGHVMVGSMDGTPYTAQLTAALSIAARQEHSHLQDYALSYGIGLRTKKDAGFLYDRELREKRMKEKAIRNVHDEANACRDKLEVFANRFDVAMHIERAPPHHRLPTEASTQFAKGATAFVSDCSTRSWSEAFASMRSPIRAKTAAKSARTEEVPLFKTTYGSIPTGFHGLLPDTRSGTGIERRMPSTQVYKGRPHCFGEFCSLDPTSVYETVRKTRESEMKNEEGVGISPGALGNPLGSDERRGFKKRFHFGTIAMQAVNSKIEDNRRRADGPSKDADADKEAVEHVVDDSPVTYQGRRASEADYEVAFKSALMARVEASMTNFDYLSIVLEYAQLGFEVEDIMSECARLALMRVAELCRDEAYRMACSLVPRSGGTQSAINISAMNLMEEAHRNLIYNKALAKVHPSKFYQTVPVCATCFRLYSSMDVQRESIVFGSGRSLRSRGRARSRGCSPSAGTHPLPNDSPLRAHSSSNTGGKEIRGKSLKKNSSNLSDSRFPASLVLSRAKMEHSQPLPRLNDPSRPAQDDRRPAQPQAIYQSRAASSKSASTPDIDYGKFVFEPEKAIDSHPHPSFRTVHSPSSQSVPARVYRKSNSPTNELPSEADSIHSNPGGGGEAFEKPKQRHKDKFFSREISDRRSSAVPSSDSSAHFQSGHGRISGPFVAPMKSHSAIAAIHMHSGGTSAGSISHRAKEHTEGGGAEIRSLALISTPSIEGGDMAPLPSDVVIHGDDSSMRERVATQATSHSEVNNVSNLVSEGGGHHGAELPQEEEGTTDFRSANDSVQFASTAPEPIDEIKVVHTSIDRAPPPVLPAQD